MKNGTCFKPAKRIFLIPENYRYEYLILEAIEKGNEKRIKSFIKMGKLIVIK